VLRPYLLLIVCVSIWGSNFVFGSMLAGQFSPLYLTTARLFFIASFLFLYAKWRSAPLRVRGSDAWTLLILLGIIGVGCNQWSFYQGMQTADPTTSALILALTPIVTALLAAIFLKEPLTIRWGAGSLAALCGVYLVVRNGEELRLQAGHLWIVITMVTFAISIVLVRMLARTLSTLTITLYASIVGFLALLPWALTTLPSAQISHRFEAWSLLVATAILMHGIVTLVWNRQLQKVGAANAAMFANLEPFVAMIVGYLLLGQAVTQHQLLGSLLIVGGVTLSSFSSKAWRISSASVMNDR